MQISFCENRWCPPFVAALVLVCFCAPALREQWGHNWCIPPYLNRSVNPSLTEPIPDGNLTSIWCQDCSFPSLFHWLPWCHAESIKPCWGIWEEVKLCFRPVGLLPDKDSKQSGQVQPASTLQTTNLDRTARGIEMSSGMTAACERACVGRYVHEGALWWDNTLVFALCMCLVDEVGVRGYCGSRRWCV